MSRTVIITFVWLHANLVGVLVPVRVCWVLRIAFITKEKTYSINLAIAYISNTADALHVRRDVKVVVNNIEEVAGDAVETCFDPGFSTGCFEHMMVTIAITSDF